MSNAETTQLVLELKEQEQDYEFYPTTKEIIACIHEHINSHWEIEHYSNKVLDIGCGTENFRKHIKDLHHERELWKENASKRPDGSYDNGIRNARNWYISEYFVMEKSKILLQQLDKKTIVLGTDFYDNTLVDKEMDLIFCNPPYSAYAEWTKRIIAESNCKYIYLVIPERWKEDAEIQKTIETIGVEAEAIGSFDFLNAERSARAKVDVVFIDKTKVPTDNAFDRWFDETFKMRDKEEKSEWKIEEEKEKDIKNELVGGKNKGEMLINLYEAEQRKLYEHFLAISGLDVDILESINIQKSAVKKALKERIQGLKTLYWKIVFDELDEITSRLTSKTREKMFNRFKSLQTVDFTIQNIYSLIIWVIKNANNYYNDQMIEFFKTLSSPENCRAYKSNDRIGTRNWRFADENSHYTLDYRIICDNLSFSNYYSWDKEIDKWKAMQTIDDICTIANNLNFEVGIRDVPKDYGKKYTILLKSGETFCDFRIYKNGNTHLKFNKEFMKALNVEVSRLLGWINKPEDIAREFDDEIKEGAEKYFKYNMQFSITGNGIKLLGTTKS